MKLANFIPMTVVALAATSATAGTLLDYNCETPKCGFHGELAVGGGFLFRKVGGYCTTCRQFVSMSWSTKPATGDAKQSQEKAPDEVDMAPQKVGTVWNPATGLNDTLYPCPKCRKPFMDIDPLSLLRAGRSGHTSLWCPRCTNLTFKVERRGEYD